MWGAESINNLVPTAVEPVVRQPRYKSKHSATQEPTGSSFKTKAAGKAGNFGAPIGANRKNPSAFLKKNTGIGPGGFKKSTEPRQRQTGRTMPAVPNRSDRPVMGLQSTKNYITANAVEAILAVPGNRARVQQQAPLYSQKADYGKVPEYLRDVKDEIERENEMIQQYLQQGEGEAYDPYREEEEEVSDEEVEMLIDALKTKWDNTNKKYQKMCHMVKLDTIGKVRRKEAMEKELDQLEKDIQSLESKRSHA